MKFVLNLKNRIKLFIFKIKLLFSNLKYFITRLKKIKFVLTKYILFI